MFMKHFEVCFLSLLFGRERGIQSDLYRRKNRQLRTLAYAKTDYALRR